MPQYLGGERGTFTEGVGGAEGVCLDGGLPEEVFRRSFEGVRLFEWVPPKGVWVVREI